MTDVKSFQRQSIAAILEERPLFEEDERIAKAVGHLRESGNYEVFLAQGRHYSSVTVRDLMYASDPANTKLGALAYLVPDMPRDGTIADAARLMYDHRLRALPISVEPAAFAAASVWGILKQMNGSLDLPIEASEIMTQNPVTIDTEDTVSKARSIMTNRSFDHLPVTKGGRLTGILTSSDVLFHLMSEERAPLRGDAQVRFDYPVERIAQDFVFEVEPTAAASKVVSLMVEKKTSSVLVARGEELRGIITPRDVMKSILGPKEKRLRYYIVGLPSEPFEAEAAKGKFERLSSILTKAFPYIEEIRAVIKTKQISDQRARYEVNVDIYTPKERFAYSETGYDLAVVFESLGLDEEVAFIEAIEGDKDSWRRQMEDKPAVARTLTRVPVVSSLGVTGSPRMKNTLPGLKWVRWLGGWGDEVKSHSVPVKDYRNNYGCSRDLAPGFLLPVD